MYYNACFIVLASLYGMLRGHSRFTFLVSIVGSLCTEAAALRSHGVLCSQLLQEPCTGLYSGMHHMLALHVHSDTQIKTLCVLWSAIGRQTLAHAAKQAWLKAALTCNYYAYTCTCKGISMCVVVSVHNDHTYMYIFLFVYTHVHASIDR